MSNAFPAPFRSRLVQWELFPAIHHSSPPTFFPLKETRAGGVVLPPYVLSCPFIPLYMLSLLSFFFRRTLEESGFYNLLHAASLTTPLFAKVGCYSIFFPALWVLSLFLSLIFRLSQVFSSAAWWSSSFSLPILMPPHLFSCFFFSKHRNCVIIFPLQFTY